MHYEILEARKQNPPTMNVASQPGKLLLIANRYLLMVNDVHKPIDEKIAARSIQDTFASN